MLQRRRKRKHADPAIAAIALELLEAGEPFRYSLWRDDNELARLANARAEAVRLRYLAGMTYSDALLGRRAALRDAADVPEGAPYAGDYRAAIVRAEKHGMIVLATEIALRADAGE